MTGDFESAALGMDILWQYGLYHTQLKHWLEFYPKDRILVVALERLNRDPEGEFGRVLSFLGARGTWVPEAEDQNQGAERTRKLPFHDLVVDSPVATALRRALVPKWVRTKIREARQIRELEVSDEARMMIADKVRGDIRQFGELFGLDDLSPESFRDRVLERQLTFA